MNETSKNRINYIDIARGISIILMIIGHVISHTWKRQIIFSFHMPLFVIVSGYFFKENQNMKKFMKNIIYKLIFPYVLATILTNLIRMLVQKTSFINMILDTLKTLLFSYSFKGELLKNINVMSIGVLWFFPALAGSKIIFHLLFKINKLKESPLLLGLVSTIISVLGYYLGINYIWLPFSFDISLVFIIFMYLGYILKKYNLLNKILSNNILSLLIGILWLLGVKLATIEFAVRLYPLGIVCFATAVFGTIFVFKISEVIDKKIKVIGNILAWYGQNSMYILCFHHLETCTIAYNKFIKINNSLINKALISCMKIVIVSLYTILYNKLSTFILKLKTHP